MSTVGETTGAPNAFRMETSENSTNPTFKKAKMDSFQPTVHGNKRAALGVITNSTRVQPRRAAKAGNSENNGFDVGPSKGKTFCNLAPGGASFSIHVDEESPAGPKAPAATAVSRTESQSSRIQLTSSVTSLRQPFAPLSISANCPLPKIEESPPLMHDSPMLLDASIESMTQDDPEDIAKQRFEKILTVPEYAADIYAYLREAELRNRPRVRYMKRQPDITTNMRNILVDWLVEVAEEYKLHRETLFLSVNYIDRFLSQMSVLRGKLQLVGAASMFLAAKYEEIYPPEVKEFVYITDNSYTNSQVLRMEHLMLKVLSFDVAIPTINSFCEMFAKANALDDETLSLAMYLAELTLVEGESFLAYPASIIAASTLCLANHCLERNPWSPQMKETTGYDLTDLSQCIHDLHALHLKAASHPQRAVFEKYRKSKYQHVSSLLPRLDKPAGILPPAPEQAC